MVDLMDCILSGRPVDLEQVVIKGMRGSTTAARKRIIQINDTCGPAVIGQLAAMT
jgi:hypothetical protein